MLAARANASARVGGKDSEGVEGEEEGRIIMKLLLIYLLIRQ